MTSAPTAEEVPEKTLEYWLSRATDPFVPDANRAEFISGFCERVNEELEGHLVACRLLAHKIQSPHEKEAINAMSVLEACVRNCGQRFHNEIAKFRFLNEVIKILSPKYLGSQTSEKVKQKAVEMLYSWKTCLRHYPKLKQAYDMLKDQGIITQDPVYMNEFFESPPPAPKPKFASFEDEEKSRLLSQLLKSKNPDDLQAANRLIKSMVKAEDQRIEKVSKRSTDLETACNNARLLSEMIGQFDKDATSEQDAEIMKDLTDSLQKLRPALFRYASEAAEGEEDVLAEILGVNDEVGKAIEEFRMRVEPFLHSIKKIPTPFSSSASASGVNSLLNFDTQVPKNSSSAFNAADILSTSSSEASLFGDDVLMLGGGGTPLMLRRGNTGTNAVTELNDLFGVRPDITSNTLNLPGSSIQMKLAAISNVAMASSASACKPKGLLDLDELSEALIKQNLPTGATSVAQLQQTKKLSLRDLNKDKPPAATPSFSPLDPFAPSSSSTVVAGPSGVSNVSKNLSLPRKMSLTENNQQLKAEDPSTPNPTPEMSTASSPISDAENRKLASPQPLTDVNVPLENIKPTSKSPVLVLDRDQLKVILHYAANKPRHDVTTTVVSISSTRDQNLIDIRFVVKLRDCYGVVCKLQAATGTSLPAFNPIFPPTAISQVFLLASSNVTNVTAEYTLSYSAAEQHYSVSGFVDIEV